MVNLEQTKLVINIHYLFSLSKKKKKKKRIGDFNYTFPTDRTKYHYATDRTNCIDTIGQCYETKMHVYDC